MKIGMTADLHIDNISRTYLINGVSNRELDLDKQVNFMLETCIEKNVSYFVIAGDLFNKTSVNDYYFSRAAGYLKKFARNGIKVIVIPGNHEMNEEGLTLTNVLTELENKKIAICNKIGLFHLSGGCDLFLIPHVRRNEFKEYNLFTDFVKSKWKELLERKYLIVIGHFEPKGAVPGSEREMFAGSSRTIDTRIFNSSKVFCGHIHAPSMVTDNVCIIGSPVRFSLNECKETKRFVIYDTEKGVVESIALNCQKMRKVSIDFVTKDNVKFEEERLKQFKDVMVGISVKTSKANRARIISRDIISAFENVGAKILSYEVKTVKQEIEKDTKKYTTMTPVELFKRIAKKIAKKGRMEVVLRAGKDILEDLK